MSEIWFHQLVAMTLATAREFFGDRDLEARFDRELLRVRLFLHLTVVEEVTDASRETALREVISRGIAAEPGESLGFEIFWSPSDAAQARRQQAEWSPLLGLPTNMGPFGRAHAHRAKAALIALDRPANDH